MNNTNNELPRVIEQEPQDKAQRFQPSMVEFATLTGQLETDHIQTAAVITERNLDVVKQSTSTKKTSSSPLRNSFMFWLHMNHAGLSDFLMAYNLGMFNTLDSYMMTIFDWNESEKTTYISLISSLPMLVAAIVCLFIGSFAEKYGRRKVLMFTLVIAMVGNSITLIQNTIALIIGRLIIGACFGVWSSVGPLYSIEIGCKEYKGISGIIFSLHFGFGIITSFLVSLGLPTSTTEPTEYWRLILGLPIALSLAVLVCFLTVFREETATFLFLTKRDERKTRQVLQRFFTDEVAEEEIKELREIALKSTKKVGWSQLFGSKYRSRVYVSIILTLGFSYCGCNAINIFSKSMFTNIGEDESTAKLFTTIMPIGDIIGPLIAFLLIERVGRKNLFLAGEIACFFILTFFCVIGWTQVIRPLQKYLLLAYKLTFALAVAPVHWMYPSEILPPIGVGFFGFAYWILSLSTVQFTPYLLNPINAEGIIIIFPIFVIFIVIFMAYQMKETTGKNRQEIEEIYDGSYSKRSAVIMSHKNISHTPRSSRHILSDQLPHSADQI